MEIKMILDEIEEVSELFYMQKINDATMKLDSLLLHISIIISEVQDIKNNGNNIEFDENKFNSILTDALSALELKDYILLADIFKYDLTESLSVLNNIK